MRSYAIDGIDADAIVEDLLNGDGAVRLTGLFPPEDIAEARRIVMDHPDRDAGKVTHFQGAAEAEGTIALQRRVWNLLAKGEVFARMAAHPALTEDSGATAYEGRA